MDNPLLQLADMAARWADAPIPDAVDHAARRALLDWFAATLAGSGDGAAAMLDAALAGTGGTGGAVSYVGGDRVTARHAALLNGTASHVAEFDDIFRDGGYHPGSPTIAAALAVAQDIGASRDALTRAIVAGYEVGCRIALAVQPSHYRHYHTTATVGTMGAAVAVAMLRGCDAAGIGHAIAIASSFAAGHQENLQGAGLTKALHAGHAAEAGVLAGLAAAGGITGSPDSLHAPGGFAAATSDGTGNWAAAFAEAGPPITRMTIKNHGCCGHIFPALDAVAALRAGIGFGPDDIAAIHVRGYAATKSMCDRPQAATARDARFSTQYCLGASLCLGTVRLAAFTPEALERPDIRALMPRVTVEEDAALAALYPRQRQARVRVTLTDGRVLDRHQTHRKGDPEEPLTDAELAAKYDELAATALAPADARALRDLILRGDALPGPLPLTHRAAPAA